MQVTIFQFLRPFFVHLCKKWAKFLETNASFDIFHFRRERSVPRPPQRRFPINLMVERLFCLLFSVCAQRKPSIFGTCFHFVITAKEILFIRKPTKSLYFCTHSALYAANFVQLVQKQPFFLAISHLYKMKKVF